uniref:Uncharacterized protein n=1 Tax=Acanthochromis polyacanthus TaxID=80966 RepID=A0A3Q1GPM2_9TELE
VSCRLFPLCSLKNIILNVSLSSPLLTHWPTEELHPTMQLSSQECDRTLDPFSTVHRFILTPSSTTTPAPMVTLGPMVQFSPICAVGSCRGGSGTDHHHHAGVSWT